MRLLAVLVYFFAVATVIGEIVLCVLWYRDGKDQLEPLVVILGIICTICVGASGWLWRRRTKVTASSKTKGASMNIQKLRQMIAELYDDEAFMDFVQGSFNDVLRRVKPAMPKSAL